mgnify:CR=1 FL=1
MPVADKWTQAFFNATCPRTAGFSSVDLASLSVQTLLVYLEYNIFEINQNRKTDTSQNNQKRDGNKQPVMVGHYHRVSQITGK